MLSMAFPQVIITVDDMKYDIGGYYSMYNLPVPQGVIGLTGNIGGPQIFDFSEGVIDERGKIKARIIDKTLTTITLRIISFLADQII